MQGQEINRLNNIISEKISIIQYLNQKIIGLQQQNATITIRLNEMQNNINDDPLSRILNSITSINQQKQVLDRVSRSLPEQYKSFYQGYDKSAFQSLKECKNDLNNKNRQILQNTRQISKLNEQLMGFHLERQKFIQTINQEKIKFQRLQKENQNLVKNQKIYTQKNQKLKEELIINQKDFQVKRRQFQSSAQFFQQCLVSETSLIMKQFKEKVEKVRSSQNEEVLKDLFQKKKQYEVIMQEMGVQLDQRNEQVSEYAVLEDPSNRNQLSLQESSFKITNHFLKSELVKKSKFISNILMRLKNIEQLNSTEQKQNLKLRNEVKQFNKVRQQNAQLQKEVERLRIDNSLIEEKLSLSQKWQQRQLESMCLILLQNQCYHRFMQYEYGTRGYLKEIEASRKKMQKQMAERGRLQKWVSVEELIKMNRKLMQKLL